MRLYDLAKVTTSTTGTGTMSLGSAVSGFLTFDLAGVQNGDIVRYGIRDGSNSEVGLGVYTTSGATLTRNPIKSTNGDAAINLSGAAQVFICAAAEDIVTPGRFWSPPPALSAFTWVNQGAATAVQASGAGSPIMMTEPYAGSLNWRLLEVDAPTTPYSVIAKLEVEIPLANTSTAGLYFYDGTKLMGVESMTQTSMSWRVEKITNVNADGSTSASLASAINADGRSWIRLRNTGTTLYFEISKDGHNFITLYSESVGAYITPTKIGFGGVNAASGTTAYISMSSWKVVGDATF